jgi:hypothetical protein
MRGRWGAGMRAARNRDHVTSPHVSEPVTSSFVLPLTLTPRLARIASVSSVFLHHSLPSDRRLSSNRTYSIARIVGRLAIRIAPRRPRPHLARAIHSSHQLGSVRELIAGVEKD